MMTKSQLKSEALEDMIAGEDALQHSHFHSDYMHIMELHQAAEAGDSEAALMAAACYIDPSNWTLLSAKGIDYMKNATRLIKYVLDAKETPLRLRVLASNIAAKIYSKPMYHNLDIVSAIKYARYASFHAKKLPKMLHLTDEERYDILTTASDILLCNGEVEAATNPYDNNI